MNHAGSVLSDAAHSFAAKLAGGEDAPNQGRSRKDLCCHPLPQPWKPWKSRAGYHYSILADDAPAAKGGSHPSTHHLLPHAMAPFCLGGVSFPFPFHPIPPQQHRAPRGDSSVGTDHKDMLAGLPEWLVAGCAKRGASQGEGKGAGQWVAWCPLPPVPALLHLGPAVPSALQSIPWHGGARAPAAAPDVLRPHRGKL